MTTRPRTQTLRSNPGAGLLVALLLCLASGLPVVGEPDKQKDAPTRLELDGASHRLRNFEKEVERARGQPMKLSHDAKESLDRIMDLKKRFPDLPQVEELFQRARKALVLSKGEMIEVGPEVLAYRGNEKKLKETFAALAEKEWNELRSGLEGAAGVLASWPPPDPDEADLYEVIGKTVILEEFLYPANQFQDCGRDLVSVGNPSRGFYFVELYGRSWPGAYEAFRRYKREVNRDIPENAPWIMVGKITGLGYMIPDAAKEPVRQGAYGWTVQPTALYVPGCILAIADATLETGGRFSGEADLERIKSAMYTVTSIPPDVTPDRLVEIFSIAIKEKNYKLYLDCIDPRRRVTPKGLSLCAYHWDWHQHRFATFYALVKFDPPKIRVTRGYDEKASVEEFFLSEEEKDKIKAHADERVEEASVLTHAYDEKGKQYGSPKPFFLRRVGDGRWYITNFAQPF